MALHTKECVGGPISCVVFFKTRLIIVIYKSIIILITIEIYSYEIHGVLGIYLFIHASETFITFLCISFSAGMIIGVISSIIFTFTFFERIFQLLIADKGGFHTNKVVKLKSTSTIEMTEMDSEDLNRQQSSEIESELSDSQFFSEDEFSEFEKEVAGARTVF